MSSIKNNNMFNKLLIKAPKEHIPEVPKIDVINNEDVVESLQNNILEMRYILQALAREKPKVSVTAMINRDANGKMESISITEGIE